jgi:hypothetical protein
MGDRAEIEPDAVKVISLGTLPRRGGRDERPSHATRQVAAARRETSATSWRVRLLLEGAADLLGPLLLGDTLSGRRKVPVALVSSPVDTVDAEYPAGAADAVEELSGR